MTELERTNLKFRIKIKTPEKIIDLFDTLKEEEKTDPEIIETLMKTKKITKFYLDSLNKNNKEMILQIFETLPENLKNSKETIIMFIDAYDINKTEISNEQEKKNFEELKSYIDFCLEKLFEQISDSLKKNI